MTAERHDRLLPLLTTTRARRALRAQRMRPSRAMRGQRPAALLVCALSMSFVATLLPAGAYAQTVRYSFAVLSGTLQNPADEPPTQRLIEAIGRDRGLSFVVYDGDLKGQKETCRDSLYESRQAILESSRTPLVFVPGQNDWADCSTSQSGGYDPTERLDQLRQTLFSDPTSLGQNPLSLTRESEVSRFRPYRENVRWQIDDTVFIGLNVPGPNNHYLYGGGRNGEFEDRVIANSFWLEHATEYARRHNARAIVIFIQADPDPTRYERPERFAWLRFGRNEHRDGFLEFKRSLVKLAEAFRGPVLLVHPSSETLPGGFRIDQPLRNDKGIRVDNLTRIEFAPRDRLNQWIQIDADMVRRPPFRVSVRDVPKHLPMPAVSPAPTSSEPAPSLPALPSLPPASDLSPVPHETSPTTREAPHSGSTNENASAPSGTLAPMPTSPASPVSTASAASAVSPALPMQLPPILPTPSASPSASPAASSVQRGP